MSFSGNKEKMESESINEESSSEIVTLHKKIEYSNKELEQNNELENEQTLNDNNNENVNENNNENNNGNNNENGVDNSKNNGNGSFDNNYNYEQNKKEIMEKIKIRKQQAELVEKYINETGINTSFKIIFSELLSKKIPIENYYTYTASRLRQIGREKEALDRKNKK